MNKLSNKTRQKKRKWLNFDFKYNVLSNRLIINYYYISKNHIELIEIYVFCFIDKIINRWIQWSKMHLNYYIKNIDFT